MISAPVSSTSRCRIAFTAPWVPTGMNAGVCTTPCGVSNSPSRAAPSVARTVKRNAGTLLLSRSVKKLRVGIIYGGRSGEHEVSVVSAASIFKHLDRTRYDAVPVVIEKSGRWVLGGRAPEVLSAGAVGEMPPSEALQPTEPSAAVAGSGFDVIFPVLHGPYGEDGTVQGLLELANIPYVGAGVLGSAVGMDKAVMKTLFAAAGLPIVPHLTVLRREWVKDAASISKRAADHLRFPMFVKPANLGSSVGISKAATPSELPAAMELAFQFDRKAVVEAAVPNTREI